MLAAPSPPSSSTSVPRSPCPFAGFIGSLPFCYGRAGTVPSRRVVLRGISAAGSSICPPQCYSEALGIDMWKCVDIWRAFFCRRSSKLVQEMKLKAKMVGYWLQGLTRSGHYLLKMLFAASVLQTTALLSTDYGVPFVPASAAADSIRCSNGLLNSFPSFSSAGEVTSVP
ncbi:hypothetical protein E2562_002491 [Oryza meyeriana var. granulata]|uniref:Uncharacterized protein n=1 Tax=Oryza meyeriana var. granulata TaxID=110450 RepID=A0A6G1F2T3_9ORYZ|nr:hypothetical protein E2562_002491 [Oryza meyeriana var. granulata]